MSSGGLDLERLEEMLYHESGLLGVSGISSDVRTLLPSSDARAAEALDLFVYRIGRELRSLAAALGGIDALVLTEGALAKTRFPSALEYALTPVGWASTWMSRPTERADRALAAQAAVFPLWLVRADEELRSRGILAACLEPQKGKHSSKLLGPAGLLSPIP